MNIFGPSLLKGAASVLGSSGLPAGQPDKTPPKPDLDVKICRAHFGSLALLGLATGGAAGAAAGTAACGASVLTAPAALLCGSLGGIVGASAGAVGGAMTALGSPHCREGVVRKGCDNGGVPPMPPMPPSLPNCPTHGVAHSCDSNPTPSRGSHGARALPTAGNCSGGSCSSGGCGCR